MCCPCCGSASSAKSHIGKVKFSEFQYRYLRCRDCGSLYADPMPEPSLLERIYAPEYVETHYAPELANEGSSADLAQETRRALELMVLRKPNGRLLDVGCGAGRFLRMAADAGLVAEGHEMTAGAAAATAERTGLPVHSGPLGNLRGRYDVIHLADVLEHSPRPELLLRDAIPLLATNGVLVLRGPIENQRNLFQAVTVLGRTLRNRFLGERLVEMPPYHVNLFTLRGWRALMGRAQLLTLGEEITEIHWPAPETFSPSAISLVKAASLALTRSPLGKPLSLGNRVMGLFEPRAGGVSSAVIS